MPAIPNKELMAELENGVFAETACSAEVHTIYPLNHCHWAGRTKFQDVIIADCPAYGKTLFLDGEIQSAESDEAIYHEHLVHPLLYSLCNVPYKKVLVVGGGEGATVREVLKWSAVSVASVDWVDIDGDLVSLCREHLRWADDSVYNDPRVKYHAADINMFLDGTKEVYDVIILDLPDPDVDELVKSEIKDDVLYGELFRHRIFSHLTMTGGVVTHCGPIRPGGDENKSRPGMAWVRDNLFKDVELGMLPYHVFIPSFQGEWGFMMVSPSDPKKEVAFPAGMRVMDTETLAVAFTWPKYWGVWD